MAIPSKEKEFEPNYDLDLEPEKRSFINNRGNTNVAATTENVAANADIVAATDDAPLGSLCQDRLAVETKDRKNTHSRVLTGGNGISRRIFPYGFLQSTLVSDSTVGISFLYIRFKTLFSLRNHLRSLMTHDFPPSTGAFLHHLAHHDSPTEQCTLSPFHWSFSPSLGPSCYLN